MSEEPNPAADISRVISTLDQRARQTQKRTYVASGVSIFIALAVAGTSIFFAYKYERRANDAKRQAALYTKLAQGAKDEQAVAERKAEDARASRAQAEEAMRNALEKINDAARLVETAAQADERVRTLQEEVKSFGKVPFDLAEEIRKLSGDSSESAKKAIRIQDWLLEHGVVPSQPPPQDPLEKLSKPFEKAAGALFALPPGKWATREFFEMLRLCRQDRRYVGMLVKFALDDKNKGNEAGWLYSALVFRNIAYEDSEKSPRRLEEYVRDLLPFLNAALGRSPQVAGQARDILSFLPKQQQLGIDMDKRKYVVTVSLPEAAELIEELQNAGYTVGGFKLAQATKKSSQAIWLGANVPFPYAKEVLSKALKSHDELQYLDYNDHKNEIFLGGDPDAARQEGCLPLTKDDKLWDRLSNIDSQEALRAFVDSSKTAPAAKK